MRRGEKAIYGLAMPFNGFYWEYERLTNTFIFEKTNKESVKLDSLVGATLEHDYLKELGRTGRNLFLTLHERGLFFKLIPDTPLANDAYGKVKRRQIKYCSVSYAVKEETRDAKAEIKAREIARLIGINEKIVVNMYKKILVYEVCIGNHPANKATFCTTNKNDSRLKGVKFNEDVNVP